MTLNVQQSSFEELRKHNERRARIAALLEARRERLASIERVIQVQREHRLRNNAADRVNPPAG